MSTDILKSNLTILESALLSLDPVASLEMCHTRGILPPAVAALVGFGGGSQGHKDLWAHTKQVVSQCPLELTTRFAALYHDVGKVVTLGRNNKGRIAFHGHEKVSRSLWEKDSRSWIVFYSADILEHIAVLIENLGLIEGYDSAWTDSAVRRIFKEAAPHFDELIRLSKADVTSKYQKNHVAIHAKMDELSKRAYVLQEEDNKPKALPKGLGLSVATELGIKPGKAVGEAMDRLKQAVEAGLLPRQAETEIYLNFLRQKQ